MLEKAGTARIMSRRDHICVVQAIYKSNLEDEIEKMSCYLVYRRVHADDATKRL